MPSRWPSELRHGAWLACMVEALSTEFSTYSELQATGTSTPKAFISVLLAIALPVILNGPQDNETPAGLRDVLSVMTGLGAEPRNVLPEGVHCGIVWACPTGQVALTYPESDLSGRQAPDSSTSFSVIPASSVSLPLAFVW